MSTRSGNYGASRQSLTNAASRSGEMAQKLSQPPSSVSKPLYPTQSNGNIQLLPMYQQHPVEKEVVDLSNTTPPSLSPVSSASATYDDPELEQPRSDQSTSKKRVDQEREHEHDKRQKVIPRINTFVQNLSERKNENKTIRFLRDIYKKLSSISKIIDPIVNEIFISPEYDGVFRMSDMFEYASIIAHIRYVILLSEKRDGLDDPSTEMVGDKPRRVYEGLMKKYTCQKYIDYMIDLVTKAMVKDHNTMIDICETSSDYSFPEDYDKEVKSLLEFIHMAF
jgi:hypothetical protein